MLISFIIPVYNGEEVIEKCIYSFSVIKSMDIEIIIINDGSQDKTEIKLKELMQIEPRLISFYQENSGVSKARNLGMEKAKGKYIAFADCDDMVLSEYNQLIQWIKESDLDIYCCDYIEKSYHDRLIRTKQAIRPGKNTKITFWQELLAGKSNNVWCNIYRRKIIQNNNIEFPVDMIMGEDAVFNLKFAKYCESIWYHAKPVYEYNMLEDGSAMHQFKQRYILDYIRLYDTFNRLHLLEPELNFDSRERHYLARVFGSLFYSGQNIDKSVEQQFLKSDLYVRLMAANYKDKQSKVKKMMIKARLYHLRVVRNLLNR